MAASAPKRQKVIERFQQVALLEAERKFRKACNQIHLLNRHLESVQLRYNKAKQENFRSFRYNLRLKLAVIEGTRNMYYDYAHVQAEIVAELRRQLFGDVMDSAFDDVEEDETENEEE